MYQKLKSFSKNREVGTSKSSILDRFRFFKNEKNRTICIKNLQTWNDRLTFLCRDSNQRQPSGWTSELESGHKLPAVGGLFNSLFSTIKNHWNCTCNLRHEAMLCLKIPHIASLRRNLMELEFELLLLSKPGKDSGLACWLEGRVLVQNSRYACFPA